MADNRWVQLAMGAGILKAVLFWERRRLNWPAAANTLPMPWSRNALRVACVQWEMTPERDLEAWLYRVTQVLDTAHREGCAVTVFPEDMALPLLGLLTERMGKPFTSSLDAGQVGRRLKAWAPIVVPFYRQVFARLARLYGMTLVAGSALGVHKGYFENRAYVYGPDGAELVAQPKLHPLPLEVSWGIQPGRYLVRQPRGDLPLVTVVCNDATFFETYRMAARIGGELVAVPIADPTPQWDSAKARRGAWARTQESGIASLVSAATGSLFGIQLTGKAGVYVPVGLTEDESGILAESPDPRGQGVVLATLDLDAIAAYRRQVLPLLRTDVIGRWLAPRYRSLAAVQAGELAIGSSERAIDDLNLPAKGL